MSNTFQTKILKFLKIKRRAVVRTIDFLVSFTLFIILLTQFFLIIINMNLNLASTSTVEENPAKLFANKIIGDSGSYDWGRNPGSPKVFGLASDMSHSNSIDYIDLAKLARLNGELNYLSINDTYSYITPESIVANFSGTLSNTAFQLTTRPPLRVIASYDNSSNPGTFNVDVLSWSNFPLENIKIEIYLLELLIRMEIIGLGPEIKA